MDEARALPTISERCQRTRASHAVKALNAAGSNRKYVITTSGTRISKASIPYLIAGGILRIRLILWICQGGKRPSGYAWIVKSEAPAGGELAGAGLLTFQRENSEECSCNPFQNKYLTPVKLTRGNKKPRGRREPG